MCAIGRKAFGVHCTCVYKWISFDSVCFKSIFYETVISGALKIIEWLFEEFETDGEWLWSGEKENDVLTQYKRYSSWNRMG